jgi:subtilisin family serine protease
MRALILGALCLGLPALAAAAPADGGAPWPFLPNDDIGAYTFKQAHPTWDGRGVVVAVFDTGVDAFAPGLATTSTGETKVIEARDFSTQGDWDLVEAERDTSGAPAYRLPDGLRLAGLPALVAAVAPGPDDRVYIGVIPESRFLNSNGVSDLNDDGDKGDRFGVLVWAADRAAVEGALGTGRGLERLAALNETARRTVARERASARVWLVVVDTDGDGSLADETALRDYHVNYDTFRLTAPDAPKARTLMAWSANVVTQDDRLGAPRPPRLELHFDDGAHGSHCAGIAAGSRVGGQEGMDGVAPGAWVMSCKIGDNTLAGGASRTESMRRAFAHAADFARDYGLPLVISMSFGVNSVEEGDAAYEKFLDEEMPKHPDVVYCTSAGNEGPGLSSVGLPAASPGVIASGAYLSPSAGAALYSARLSRAQLFGFSSRGGELPKPDVVAPGAALSTVPGWVDGSARMSGTSMACPTTAGAVACLLGAARQEGLTVHWGMVKRALIAGARPVPGLELLAQGGGLVDVAGAWEILSQLARSRTAAQVLDYRLATECPFQADGLAPAAYWRVPGGAPVAPKTVTFTVHPIFHPDLTPDQKDAFFRAFTFRSEAGWVRVVTGRAYLRGDMDMTVDLQYDGAQLTRPGLYATRVLARQDGGDLSGPAAQEFTLWNSVVTGEPFGPVTGWSRTWEGRDLPPSGVHRRFVEAPAGASALRVRLEVSAGVGAGKGARVSTEICDPEGQTRGGFAGVASVEGVSVRDQTILTPELRPGVWEVLCAAPIAALESSAYRLTVSFDAYVCEPPVLAALPRGAAGQPAQGELRVTRAFPGLFRGAAQAVVQGFRREREISVEADDIWSLDFTLTRDTPRAAFHFTMDESTANLFTDCAVNIVDDKGERVLTDGFAGLEARAEWSLPAGVEKGTYKLEVVGGFALARDREKWGFRIEEEYLLADPVTGGVKRGEAAEFALYSGVPTTLAVTFPGSWPEPPVGLRPFGAVKFLDRNLGDRVPGDRDGRLVLEVPIRLE